MQPTREHGISITSLVSVEAIASRAYVIFAETRYNYTRAEEALNSSTIQ